MVEQVASTHQVKHTSAIGTRYDSVDSASVQVFLAALPAGEVLRLFDRRVLTGAHDPESVAEYQQILETVRDDGYAVNDGRTSAEEVGLAMGSDTVARLLHDNGFSLQANSKTLEGVSHPDRDAQFSYINDQATAHLTASDPVISVDAKKKLRHEVARSE